MGEVWLAQGPDGGRVALKVLPAALAASGEGAARFRREREALARVSHPNVVRALGPSETDDALGLAFFPMELVLGKSLADLLAEHGPFETAEAARLCAETARALAAAHAAGLVHRDVKPSNLLVDREGRVRLTDFGLARALDASSLTGTGKTLGTPAYMAPEQAAGKEAGPAADLYALGCVAYELLAGRPPFRAESALAVLRMHVEAEPPRLPATAPDEYAALVARILAKDPATRPSAEEVACALEAIAGASPVDAAARAAIERDTASFAHLALAPARRSRWHLAIAAAAALVGAAAVAGWLASGGVGAPLPERTVRLTLWDGPVARGTLLRTDPDFFVLRAPDGTERRVPRGEVRAIDYEDRIR